MPLQRTSKSTQSTTRYRIPKIQKKSKRVSWDPTNILDQARALNLLPAKTSPADVAFAEAMVQLRYEFANR